MARDTYQEIKASMREALIDHFNPDALDTEPFIVALDVLVEFVEALPKYEVDDDVTAKQRLAGILRGASHQIGDLS